MHKMLFTVLGASATIFSKEPSCFSMEETRVPEKVPVPF
jgi:hypothetical protein